jgi:ABC-type polysaccharide/polyol phosphate transport system ATPase subunit
VSDATPAIEVRGLGVRYNLTLTRRTTLKSTLARLGRRSGAPGARHFWALKDLDLAVQHGETIGLIGPNGAGKSTLLLAIAGILEPSTGSILVDGRVSTLLTLGAGFDADLTGRDNIRLAGAFLGIEGKELEALTPGILDFADIGDFIDAPVKTYSLGMKARLGFSIATAITPDILLLDEVLGTGDQEFRAKSQLRIRELMTQAKAIVMVTHDLTYVTEFCNRAVLLEQGRLVHDGAPDETVALYRERVTTNKLLAAGTSGRFEGAAAP